VREKSDYKKVEKGGVFLIKMRAREFFQPTIIKITRPWFERVRFLKIILISEELIEAHVYFHSRYEKFLQDSILLARVVSEKAMRSLIKKCCIKFVEI